MGIAGAMNEVATLKEAVSKAESNAAMERTEREKQEVRVAEVRKNRRVWSVTQRLKDSRHRACLGS